MPFQRWGTTFVPLNVVRPNNLSPPNTWETTFAQSAIKADVSETYFAPSLPVINLTHEFAKPVYTPSDAQSSTNSAAKCVPCFVVAASNNFFRASPKAESRVAASVCVLANASLVKDVAFL